MTTNDSRLETYLAEFQPRPVRKLNILPQHASNTWPRRLAAAAILAIGAGISLWFAYRLDIPRPQVATAEPPRPIVQPAPVKSIGNLALTKLALENTGQFDLYLLNQSRNVLPDPLLERGSLRVLATE
jgi:hypothetical protein